MKWEIAPFNMSLYQFLSAIARNWLYSFWFCICVRSWCTEQLGCRAVWVVLSFTATHLNGECLQRYLKGMCELNCDHREGTKKLPSNLYMYLSIYQNFFSRHVALDEDRPKFGPFKVSCWIFDMPIDEKCTFGYGVIRDRLIECN